MTKKQPHIKYIASKLNRELLKRDASGNLVVRGFFTSDKQDMLGDIITRGATERAIPAYKQWGNIRYMHLPEPVGKVKRIGESDGLRWNEVEFVVLKDEVSKDVESGLLPALSVGILVDFESLKFLDNGGWEINEYVLAEISLVDHPANYDAVLSRSIDTEELRMPKNGKVVIINEELDEKSLEVKEEEEVVAEAAVTDLDEEKDMDPATEEVVDEFVSEDVVVKEASVDEHVDESDTELEEEPVVEELPVADEEELVEEEETLELAIPTTDTVTIVVEEVSENAAAEPEFDAEKAITALTETVKTLTELVQLTLAKMEESKAEEVIEPSAEETKALEPVVEEPDEDEQVVNRELDIQETESDEPEKPALTRKELLRLAIRQTLQKQGY